MFSDQQISERLAAVNLEDLPGVEETTFDRFDFATGGEDTVIIHRGRRSDFSDPVDFYLKSYHRCVEFLYEDEPLGKSEFAARYLSNPCRSRSLAEEDFYSFARGHTEGLKKKFPVNLDGRWEEGAIFYHDYDERHIVAATDLEYYSLYWMTTA